MKRRRRTSVKSSRDLRMCGWIYVAVGIGWIGLGIWDYVDGNGVWKFLMGAVWIALGVCVLLTPVLRRKRELADAG